MRKILNRRVKIVIAVAALACLGLVACGKAAQGEDPKDEPKETAVSPEEQGGATQEAETGTEAPTDAKASDQETTKNETLEEKTEEAIPEEEIAPDEAVPGVAKIITYNCFTTSKAGVEYAAGKKGYTRGDCLRDFLNVNRPDSIGLQEITNEWEEHIEENILTFQYDCGITYAIAGLRSSKDVKLQSGSKEYSPVLYRSDLYEVVAEGGEWLSETPDIPTKYEGIVDEDGKEHPDMKFTRVYSFAVLRDKRTGEIAYVHVNCHFDHKSDDYVNVLCAKQLAAAGQALGDEYGCPVIMTGDYNTHEDTDCYAYLANGDNGFCDAKYLTENHSDKGTFPGYWYDYGEASAGTPIDHIFVSKGNVSVDSQDVLSNKYFSDHSAMMAVVEFVGE